ncbi:hypothetical protein T484DRAFT_1650576, partial [Baffinella frigidus]
LGLGFRVPGSRFRVSGSGFRVPGSGFLVPGSGFRVQGVDMAIAPPRHRHSIEIARGCCRGGVPAYHTLGDDAGCRV